MSVVLQDLTLYSALYGFASGESGHVQVGIYFNQESDLAKARVILGSFRETAT